LSLSVIAVPAGVYIHVLTILDDEVPGVTVLNFESLDLDVLTIVFFCNHGLTIQFNQMVKSNTIFLCGDFFYEFFLPIDVFIWQIPG
jgi:hypothetical protein